MQNANFKEEFLKRSTNLTQDKITANLVCEFNEGNKWNLYLTNIRGDISLVQYLLGNSFQQDGLLPLSFLLPDKKKKTHEQIVNSILSSKDASSWDRLFEGMMSRPITIQNPDTKEQRLVYILLGLDSSECIVSDNLIRFKVTFTDKTPAKFLEEEAGGLTHDIRGPLKIAYEVAKPPLFSPLTSEQFQNLTKEQLASFYDRGLVKEEDEQIVQELIKTSLLMCGRGVEDFREDVIRNARNNATEELTDVDEELQQFIAQQRRQHKLNSATYEINGPRDLNLPRVNLLLNSAEMEALKRLLMNLILNSFEAHATLVKISTYKESFDNMPPLLVCNVDDNGDGLPESLYETFFNGSTQLKTKSTSSSAASLSEPIQQILQNRGVGTNIAINRFKSFRGEGFVMPKEENGTCFRLHIPARYSPVFFANKPSLLHPEMQQCKVLIMLVDDQFVPLKLLLSKIIRMLFSNYPAKDIKLRKCNIETWHKQEVVMQTFGDVGVFCSSSATNAYEVIKHYPVTAVITDKQIINDSMQGCSLIKEIRKFEKEEQRTPMSLTLLTSEYYEHLTAEELEVTSLNATVLIKGENKAELEDLLASIIITSTNSNVTSKL
jgi:signal transduction histidine kinase